jgi:hypothetical protein
MQSYTIRDLGMNVSGKKYLLPIDKSVSDDEIMDKVKNLFNDIYMHQSTEISKNQMEIKCLYEGYDGFYPYTIILNVFRLKYDEIKYDENASMSSMHFGCQKQRLFEKATQKEVEDGQWMISMYTENEQGSLLEELLDMNTLPGIVEKAALKEYSFFKK